jgi:putative flippase GtrA
MKVFDKSMQIINQQGIYGEIFRYLIIGGTAFVFDYGTLLLLNKAFGVNYLIAATIAFSIGIAVNYLGSVFFVFKVRSFQNAHIERVVFILIGIFGLLINDGMLFLLTGVMLIPVEFSKLITQIIVLFWNFSARKIILFREWGKK